MSIERDLAFLQSVQTLSLLGQGALRILAISVESKYIHGGEVLFNAGDQADGAYVVQEGSFRLTPENQDPFARDVIVGPATLLGELALLTETVRAVTATAMEPSTVIRIPRSLFLKMLEANPQAARRLRETIAARVDATVRDVHGLRAAFETPPGSA